jgi:serine O-acetyltransferase
MLLAEDRRRYHGNWHTAAGFWATAAYRVRWTRKRAGIINKLGLLPVDLVTTIVRWAMTDAEIPSSAEIGPGLYLPHPQGVIVGQRVRIGAKVAIFQQVTLGAWEGGQPTVRLGTAIFAGAKLIGKLTVGRSCYVGANAVVTRDVPDWHTASGIPATNKPRRHNPNPKPLRRAA